MKKILFSLLLIGFAFTQIPTTQDILYEVRDSDNSALNVNEVTSISRDTTTNATSTINYFDNYMNEGNAYRVSGTFTLGTANDTSLVYFDNDSAGTSKILKWDIRGLVATTVLITEGGEFVRAPDTLSVINLDRTSSNTSTLDAVIAVYEDSTLTTSYGSTLFDISFGALQSTEGTMILKDDDLTVIKITTDANTNKVNYNFEIIEDE